MFDDYFKPYSAERRGDLETYLRECDEGGADNLFEGPEHFIEICALGLTKPNWTIVRVNQSPIPDIAYVVTEAFQLSSSGRGSYNMSLMGAPEGTYEAQQALANRQWSIHHLDLHRLYGISTDESPE